jgi:catalase
VLCVVVGVSISSFTNQLGMGRLARGTELANPAKSPQPNGTSEASEQKAKDIQAIVEMQLGVMRSTNPHVRGQHAKHHGCVDAEFSILDDLPEELRVGLFKTPAQYKAIVRFSNGGSHDDMQPGAHGMAIRLMDVEGKKVLPEDKSSNHDFVLVDSEVFFADTVAEMKPFTQAHVATASNSNSLKEFAQKSSRNAKIVDLFHRSSKSNVASPLATLYWSATSFRFGDRAVKYSVKPAASNSPTEARLDWEHYLREAMVNHLSRQWKPASFDFYLQVQTDAETDPIDTPSVPWKSKPVKVAVLTIHPQRFDTPERRKLCEQTAFSPWIAIEEHAPLGQINEIRREVYRASAKLRGATPLDQQP